MLALACLAVVGIVVEFKVVTRAQDSATCRMLYGKYESAHVDDSLPSDEALKRVDGWIADAHEGSRACQAAGMTFQAEFMLELLKIAEPQRRDIVATMASAEAAAAMPVNRLPGDAPPFLGEKAAEGPGIEAKLAADPAYQLAWEEKHRDDRNILLTAVSDTLILEQAGSDQFSLGRDVYDALKLKKLDKAFLLLASYVPRTGKLPTDFVTRTNAFITTVAREAHMGLWKPQKTGIPPVDFVALACWLHPENTTYLREMIATRPPRGWRNHKEPTRPYFVRERAALERLSVLTSLTPEESERLGGLKASKLGDEPPEVVELRELLHEYGSNEVRADDKFKGHVIEFAGIAGSLERGTIGGITLAVGTGAEFERPQVRCYFDDVQTKRVKALNRGDRVRVRGVVNGLAIDVMVDHCELAE